MSLVSAVAIYFIVWWLVFFLVLPWGVRTQEEDRDVFEGSVPSAPSRPGLLRKVLVTTVIAAATLAGVWWILASDLTLNDLPLPNPLEARVEAG